MEIEMRVRLTKLIRLVDKIRVSNAGIRPRLQALTITLGLDVGEII
jgi:hypothetical protein